MKSRILGTGMAAMFIMAAFFISPLVFAKEKGAEDLKQKVIVQVDGLTCPFCAYGLEKRIKKLPAVRESTINIKKGTVTLFQKEERHIKIDAVKKAVESGGFTPREIRVELVGKLVEWNGKTALSIASTDEKGRKDETKYLLKANEQLKKLKASMKSPDESLFIAGKVVKETPDKHTDHPYTIIIERRLAISKKGEVNR